MTNLVALLITLLILGLIVLLIFWIVDMLPFPATPKLIVKCIVGLIVLLYLVGLLLGSAPYPVHWRN